MKRTLAASCRKATLLGLVPEEMSFLDPDQVEALAEAIDPRHRALIYTAAYTGMRWGSLLRSRSRD